MKRVITETLEIEKPELEFIILQALRQRLPDALMVEFYCVEQGDGTIRVAGATVSSGKRTTEE